LPSGFSAAWIPSGGRISKGCWRNEKPWTKHSGFSIWRHSVSTCRRRETRRCSSNFHIPIRRYRM